MSASLIGMDQRALMGTRCRSTALLLAASMLAATSSSVAAGTGDHDRVDSALLAQGVHLVPGTFVAGEQPDGNTVILDAPEGLIVFDTGRHPHHSDRILAAARAAGRPVAAVINSHWHLDHVSGNIALREAFPQLTVHASNGIDAALTGFLATYRKQLLHALDGEATAAQKATWRAELARVEKGHELRPTHPVLRDETRSIAGRKLQLYLQSDAVSAGDVWVFDPDSRVLLAGDLVTLPAPLFDTACAARWSRSLQRLRDVDFALLVPGHGAPMSRPQFERYIDAFDRLLVCAAGERGARSCVSSWKTDLGDLLVPGQSELATRQLDYYISRVLRGDRSEYCPHPPAQEPVQD